LIRSEEKAAAGEPRKDNNFVLDKTKLVVSDKDYSKIIDMLQRDLDFLKKNRIIDYSLLIGIHYVSKGKEINLTLAKEDAPSNERNYIIGNQLSTGRSINPLFEGSPNCSKSDKPSYNNSSQGK